MVLHSLAPAHQELQAVPERRQDEAQQHVLCGQLRQVGTSVFSRYC